MKYISSLFYSRDIFKLVCVFSITCLISSNVFSQKQDSFISNDKEINIEEFDQKMLTMINEVNIPALSLAVIEDNKITYFKNYGYKQTSKKKKVNERTVWEGCSLSKSFLVFAAHLLVDEGKLDLDRPMYKYMEFEPLKDDSLTRLITPRMILSHSSGIENWQWTYDWGRIELVSVPGKKHVYSGLGYNYLSDVMEIILDEPYEKFIKKLVLKPLNLKNTYLKYRKHSLNPLHSGSPGNYCIGHNNLGFEAEKFINYKSLPAGGVSTNAKDYATLLLSMFDRKHLSKARVDDITDEFIVDNAFNPHYYWGAGYEVTVYDNDTIIHQAGDNSAFKGNVFYSISQKRGFVYFANSQRGKTLSDYINKETVNLKIDNYLDKYYFEQYPEKTITDLINIYLEGDTTDLYAKIEELIQADKINSNTLAELGDRLSEANREVSLFLYRKNTRLYPNDPLAYASLGYDYYYTAQYKIAYEYFLKARELKYDVEDLDHLIKLNKIKWQESLKEKSKLTE